MHRLFAAMPPTVAAALHGLAHLGLLHRCQAVVEISYRGDHFRAFAGNGGRFFGQQQTCPCAVKFFTGHQRLQFGTRVGGGADQRRPLCLQLVGQHSQALPLLSGEVQLAGHPFDDFAALEGLLFTKCMRQTG